MITNVDEKTAQALKDFMEWFVSEYDGHWLPADYNKTIDKLDGYRMGLRDAEEVTIVSSAVTLLRDAQTLLDIIKRYTDWKYR